MKITLFILLGILVGGVTSLLFFQMESVWKKSVTFGAGGIGFLGTFFIISSRLGINKELNTELFTYYLLSIIISAIVVFYLLCSYLKRQEENFRIKPLDIIMGYQDLKKMYYENRQREIDKLIGYEELKAENNKLLETEKHLKAKQQVLAKQKEDYDKAALEILHFDLPINNCIPVDGTFIKLLPSCTNDLIRFTEHVSKHTQQFINKYSDYKGREQEFIEGYFLSLCTYIATYLFDNKDCRVHVRYLDSNYSYIKLIASLGNELFDKPISPMTSEKGMIHEASEAKRSLIKTLNMDHHIPGKNDHIWEDYITMVFDEISDNGMPLISMGISVNNREKYKYQLYFLNYCRIEQVIQNNVIDFCVKCNVVDILKKYREAG